MMKKIAILLISLLSMAAHSGEVYLHTSHYLGSPLGDKLDIDGNLPYWGAVGVSYETDDRLFEIKTEFMHRSNADKSGISVDDVEYELNVLRVGFEYKFKIFGGD